MEHETLFHGLPDIYGSNWYDNIHMKDVLCTTPRSNSRPFEDFKHPRAVGSSFERNPDFNFNNNPSPSETEDWVRDTLRALESMPSSPLQMHKWSNEHGKFPAPGAAFLPSPMPTKSPSCVKIHGQTTLSGDFSPKMHTTPQDSRTDSIPPEQLRLTSEERTNHSSPQEPQRPPAKRFKASSKPTASAKNLPGKKSRRGRKPLNISNEDGANPALSAKRESHLEKNRLAAHKCRQKKKEWVEELEMQARELTAIRAHLKSHVAMLREEVLALKNEVLSHANCGCGRIDAYLKQTATQISPSSPAIAVELLTNVGSKEAEDVTELEDKDVYDRLEDILKMEGGG